MTKQEIEETYGQSKYQIWLQIALQYYLRGLSVSGSFMMADDFVTALEKLPNPEIVTEL